MTLHKIGQNKVDGKTNGSGSYDATELLKKKTLKYGLISSRKQKNKKTYTDKLSSNRLKLDKTRKTDEKMEVFHMHCFKKRIWVDFI